MSVKIITASIGSEIDVVAARQRARQIAGLCGFNQQDQARIGTAVSELARNVYNYAGKGRIEFGIEGATAPQVLSIAIVDNGPGIADLELILAGGYHSSTGMGLGILGARRLMDRCDIRTAPGRGTEIVLQKVFPKEAPALGARQIGDFSAQLATLSRDVTLSEVQQQNQELLRALDELKTRQEQLMHLTRELEDTNRGVVALYAELDEKADHLRRADQMKSRFLSNMSHEFRTPLSSIRALAKLLLERSDGELTGEQEKQVNYILQGAVSLSELVNDLLDLAKIEAGKVDVRPVGVDVADMFSALRGMLRPLLVSDRLNLTFGEVAPGLQLHTDEAKLSQILRNFISNALKFTEAGAITVSVARVPHQAALRFSVADTGIGIAPADLQTIFEEFGQVENHLQRSVKGTGLGLPLCRNLAHLLGGRVEVESLPGHGSTFSVVLPETFMAPAAAAPYRATVDTPADARLPVLIVEDNAQIQMIYEKFLADTEFRAVPARGLREADDLWRAAAPVAVILDIVLAGEDAWRWLAECKNDSRRRAVPVIIASEVDDPRKGLALGADAYYIKPMLRRQLLDSLRMLVDQAAPGAAGQPPP